MSWFRRNQLSVVESPNWDYVYALETRLNRLEVGLLRRAGWSMTDTYLWDSPGPGRSAPMSQQDAITVEMSRSREEAGV